MKKKINTGKNKVVRILLIIASVFLLLISIWLGFSFFSMKSEKPYVSILIDVESELLASKVKRDFPTVDGKYYRYSFPIILEEYSVVPGGIEITGIPYNYKNYYESRDEARFTYLLEDNKGDFDFAQLEWNHPLVVTLQYRVDDNLKKFTEYAQCTLKTAYSRIFNVDNRCGTGNCYVQRDINKWEIEMMNKDLAQKTEYFNSFDLDTIKKSLLNFYITDEAGVFIADSFKVRSVQTSLADGAYRFESEFISENSENKNSALIPWVSSGVSYLYKTNYEDYLEIDLFEYIKTILALYPEEIGKTYLDCQMSYETISNLNNCNTLGCKEVKEDLFGFCKKSLDYELSVYTDYIKDYRGFDYDTSMNAFLFFVPSEMIYFNRIVDELDLNEKKYDKDLIEAYYQNVERINDSAHNIIGNCHLFKNAEEINSYYSDVRYSIKAQEIYKSLPDIVDLCDNIVKEKYCSLELSQKMVCIDAMSYNYPDSSRELLYDLFYRHFNLSPIAPKMPAYENLRDLLRSSVFQNQNIPLVDYGYFVQRKEHLQDEKVSISTTANLMDSYYFIYLLNRIEDAK